VQCSAGVHFILKGTMAECVKQRHASRVQHKIKWN